MPGHLLSWTFLFLIYLFTTQSCSSSPVIDRHKLIPVEQAIISETSELGNVTVKIEKGPEYITVTNYTEVKETTHKPEEEVGDKTTYYGVVFFLSSVLVATCLFGLACLYEYKRVLRGYVRRTRTMLMNACLKCSWSPHHKSCEDDDFCSYYRTTDNHIDKNKHFIHFIRALTEPEKQKLIPCPDECALCNQYKKACTTCSSVDLQNELQRLESVDVPSHPTVTFNKETEHVEINMPRRNLKLCNSQVSGCECNNGMAQSVDYSHAKTDYGSPATIDAEQVTSNEMNNRKTSCVGNLRRILVNGKKRKGKNPNPRHVTFSALEIVHEF